jgi:Xaa-Pro dipeptidase
MNTRKTLLTKEINQRLNYLQEQLVEKDWDGCLITSNVNLYYYSGTMQVAYLFVPRQGEPTLFVRKNYKRAIEESPLSRILKIRKPEDMQDLLAAEYGSPGKIAMELEKLDAKTYLRLKNIFAEAEVIDVTGLIRSQRAVKSSYELELLKENGQKAVEVFNSFPNLIEEGMKDYQLAAAVEYELRKTGHTGLVRSHGTSQDFFFGQVLVGENALVPPSYDLALGGQGLTPVFPVGTRGEVIKQGQPILIDYVVNYNGYNVDITRTYCIGNLPATPRNAYQVAQEIQEKIVAKAKPGTKCGVLYDLAVELAAKYGLEQNFMGYTEQAKFVGHGIGLELNELPVLASRFNAELQPGMVIAIEPKFVFPAMGAVGIENTFVMGEKGLENLTPIAEEIVIV